MKIVIKSLIVISALAVLFACKKEDPEPTEVRTYAPEVPSGMTALFHDTYNVDAPVLPIGTYETAARFTSDDQSNLQGGRLHSVQYYVASKPSLMQIRIYEGGVNNPGDLVYSANLISEVERNKWNTHVLSDTLLINNSDLWVAVRFTTSIEGKTIGCDPGPAQANGDWMWDAADASWLKYSNRTATSINWNIRAVIEP